ncbi:MAG: hypothetical protein JWL77_5871 [Chthonomonadaceae bacterium]|nr:hypothetical protein [Chthonomonadaceae bacterium]
MRVQFKQITDWVPNPLQPSIVIGVSPWSAQIISYDGGLLFGVWHTVGHLFTDIPSDVIKLISGVIQKITHVPEALRELGEIASKVWDYLAKGRIKDDVRTTIDGFMGMSPYDKGKRVGTIVASIIAILWYGKGFVALAKTIPSALVKLFQAAKNLPKVFQEAKVAAGLYMITRDLDATKAEQAWQQLMYKMRGPASGHSPAIRPPIQSFPKALVPWMAREGRRLAVSFAEKFRSGEMAVNVRRDIKTGEIGSRSLKDPPKTVCAFFDPYNPDRVYFGASGHPTPPEGFSAATQRMIKECGPPSLGRSYYQCGEIEAFDKAVKDGAPVGRMVFHAIDVDTLMDKPLCRNCEDWAVKYTGGSTSGLMPR